MAKPKTLLCLLLLALIMSSAQGLPKKKTGRKRAFGVGLLGGALAGAVISNAISKSVARPAQAPAQPQQSTDPRHVAVIETGATYPNGCYKQTIKEPVPGRPNAYTETVHLICPSGSPAAHPQAALGVPPPPVQLYPNLPVPVAVPPPVQYNPVAPVQFLSHPHVQPPPPPQPQPVAVLPVLPQLAPAQPAAAQPVVPQTQVVQSLPIVPVALPAANQSANPQAAVQPHAAAPHVHVQAVHAVASPAVHLQHIPLVPQPVAPQQAVPIAPVVAPAANQPGKPQVFVLSKKSVFYGKSKSASSPAASPCSVFVLLTLIGTVVFLR